MGSISLLVGEIFPLSDARRAPSFRERQSHEAKKTPRTTRITKRARSLVSCSFFGSTCLQDAPRLKSHFDISMEQHLSKCFYTREIGSKPHRLLPFGIAFASSSLSHAWLRHRPKARRLGRRRKLKILSEWACRRRCNGKKESVKLLLFSDNLPTTDGRRTREATSVLTSAMVRIYRCCSAYGPESLCAPIHREGAAIDPIRSFCLAVIVNQSLVGPGGSK